MKGVSLMTAEERVEWLNKSQDNVQAVFNLLKASEITVEQEGRLALELLQLIADLIDPYRPLRQRGAQEPGAVSTRDARAPPFGERFDRPPPLSRTRVSLSLLARSGYPRVHGGTGPPEGREEGF
jgi:hypothetical protein